MKLPSHFALNAADYDSMVRVEVSGKHREQILEALWFELPGFKIYALMADNNIETLSQTFLLLKETSPGLENGNKTIG